MAQNIISYTTNGFFKANATALTSLTEAEFTTDLSDGKEITVIIDTASSSESDIVLCCMPAGNGFGEIKVPLIPQTLNVINLTTMGIKKNDGVAEFKLTDSADSTVSPSGVKLCFVKHVTVINH